MSTVSQYTESEYESIRIKAYYLHIEDPTQSEDTNWLKAERLFNNELQKKKKKKKKKKKVRWTDKSHDFLKYYNREIYHFNSTKSSDSIYYNSPTMPFRHYICRTFSS